MHILKGAKRRRRRDSGGAKLRRAFNEPNTHTRGRNNPQPHESLRLRGIRLFSKQRQERRRCNVSPFRLTRLKLGDPASYTSVSVPFFYQGSRNTEQAITQPEHALGKGVFATKATFSALRQAFSSTRESELHRKQRRVTPNPGPPPFQQQPAIRRGRHKTGLVFTPLPSGLIT